MKLKLKKIMLSKTKSAKKSLKKFEKTLHSKFKRTKKSFKKSLKKFSKSMLIAIKLDKKSRTKYKKSLKKYSQKINVAAIKKMDKKILIPAAALLVLFFVGIGFALSSGPHPVVSAASTNSQSENGTSASSTSSSDSKGSKSPTGDPKKNAKGTPNAPITPVVRPSHPPANPKPPAGGVVGPNQVTNGSAESSADGAPTAWSKDGWGTNTTTYNYLNTGHTGSHSLQIVTTAWTDGDAKWGFNPIAVAGGKSYQFTDYYQSNVDTEVDAAYTVNGVLSFYNLGTAPASSGWSNFTTQFTAPAGATSVVVYHILNKVGTLTTDDYSMGSYTPAAFNRGIVTINFDDGWLNQYQNAVPIVESLGLQASFFIITDSSITNPDPLYMNTAQIIDLKNHGFEIGNHTKTHPDLTTLTAAQQKDEMVASQTVFQNAIGVTPSNFAYPFGAYNAATIALGNTVFSTQRTVVSGLNTKDNVNFSQLKMQEVDSNITTAQVQAWINQAIAEKGWLILTYHEIAATPSDPTDGPYTILPADFAAQMNYLKSTGVAVRTTAQAAAEVRAQL